MKWRRKIQTPYASSSTCTVMRRGHRTNGVKLSLIKRNFSLWRSHNDWCALVPLRSESSSKCMRFNMRTLAFASAPFRCYQTRRKIWQQSKKTSKRPKDIILLLDPLLVISHVYSGVTETWAGTLVPSYTRSHKFRKCLNFQKNGKSNGSSLSRLMWAVNELFKETAQHLVFKIPQCQPWLA